MPKINIKFSTVLFAALFLFLDTAKIAVPLFAASAVHEAGHIAAMYLCGIRPTTFTVYPFGVDINTGDTLSSYRSDILVATAGCAINLLLAAVTFTFIPAFAMCCTVLAVLNILPIKSLDGGRIVECALLLRMGEDEAARVVYVLSFLFIVMLWIISVYLLFYAPFNPTLFFMCVYLFASIFLKKF